MNTLRFKGPAAYVADLSRSRAFYEGLLGLDVRRVMRRGDRDIARPRSPARSCAQSSFPACLSESLAAPSVTIARR
jgi:catechol 2,3-dioxygenase-like lactoylglutathione lyase family enzyme